MDHRERWIATGSAWNWLVLLPALATLLLLGGVAVYVATDKP